MSDPNSEFNTRFKVQETKVQQKKIQLSVISEPSRNFLLHQLPFSLPSIKPVGSPEVETVIKPQEQMRKKAKSSLSFTGKKQKDLLMNQYIMDNCPVTSMH